MWNIPTPWGPVQFHFCADEARMLVYGALGALPFIGASWVWFRSKFKKHVREGQKAHHPCCHPDDEHKV